VTPPAAAVRFCRHLVKPRTVTREARAVLAGVAVGLGLMGVVAMRIDPAASSSAGGLDTVSVRVLPSVWVIREGQTFSLIARQTGLSVGQLEQLNPNVDPGELAVGARIRLRAAPNAGSRAN
jgi:hypothetical protein